MKIKINKIPELLTDTIKKGYGETIELKINGEYYEIETEVLK